MNNLKSDLDQEKEAKLLEDQERQEKYLDSQMTEFGVAKTALDKYPTMLGIPTIGMGLLLVLGTASAIGYGVKEIISNPKKIETIQHGKTKPLIQNTQSILKDTLNEDTDIKYQYDTLVPQDVREDGQEQGYSNEQIDSIWNIEKKID